MSWIEDSVAQYYRWLKEKTSIRLDAGTGWTQVVTPFLGMFNDPIEIYIKECNDRILMSDDGVTMTNLELTGVTFSHSVKRKEWLDAVLLNYDVELVDKELRTSSTIENFAQKKHNLICAISEISEMEMTAKHIVASLFRDDVKAMLDEQRVVYTPQFIAKGKSGIDFTFDFQIAKQKQEIVIKSFNTLNKMNVPQFLFSWEDIKSERERMTGKELCGLAVINDTDHEIKEEYITALTNNSADVILWSQRTTPENLRKLTAA